MSHTRRVIAANLRRLGWPEDGIEDALLVAYFELSRRADTIGDPVQVVAWLTSVAKRHLMRVSTPRELSAGLSQDLDEVAGRPITHPVSDPAAFSGLLDHLKAGLSETELEVVQLLAAGWKVHEVAALVEIAPKQVAWARDHAWRLVQGTEWDTRGRAAAIIADPQPEVSQHSIVENTIRTLPPRQREVLNYAVYGGLSPSAIADQLGITPNSARVSLHQARRSLAGRLQLGLDTIDDMLAMLSEIAAAEPDTTSAAVVTHPEMILIAFDIARLSQRSKRQRECARDRLEEIVADVIPSPAGVVPAGDALLVLLPLDAWAPGFVASLAMRTQRALETSNTRHTDQLQLRVHIDVGVVNGGGRAFSSQLVINQLRLIESDPVRNVTNVVGGALALFTSPRVHKRTVSAPGHALPQNMAFGQPITVIDKSNQSLEAWPLVVTAASRAMPA
ncbi:Uncharacterised protein [Amycolatopsis camponoti]|uniref:HTH luxR-type domain-containing protein n=2 Tax=Amycolatopsis camponoti TaxID=2606593 RepID=A0A6I8LZS5_9PSEU|nr:Uncharacterised protein [Amycolatopsis camponoti]